MALNLGAVFTELKLQLTNFQQGINKAKSSILSFTNGTTSMFSGLDQGFNKINNGFNSLSGVFFNLKTLLATLGIMKLGKDFITAGMGASRLSKVVDVMAKNLGISKDTIVEWRKELAEANVTGSSANDILSQLMQSGLHTKVEFKKLSLVAKDFAAGTLDPLTGQAMSSKEGLRNLTKAIVTLRPELLESMKIEMNLVKVYGDAAEELGKKVDQLTYEEKQMAMLNEVYRIHERSAKGLYEGTYDTANKALSSIGDAWKTLTENIGMIFEPALQRVFTSFRDMLKGANKWFLDNAKTAEEWGERVAKKGEDLAEVINDAIGKIIQNIKDWIEEQGGFEAAARKVWKVIEKVGKAIADASKWIYDNKELILKLVIAWKAWQAVMAVGTMISGLNDVAKALGLVHKNASLLIPPTPWGIVVAAGAAALYMVNKEVKKYNDELENLRESEKGVVDVLEEKGRKMEDERNASQEKIMAMENEMESLEKLGVEEGNRLERWQELNGKLQEEYQRRDELDGMIEQNTQKLRGWDEQIQQTSETLAENQEWFGMKPILTAAMDGIVDWLTQMNMTVATKLFEMFNAEPPFTEEQLHKFFGMPIGERLEVMKEIFRLAWEQFKLIISNKWEEIKTKTEEKTNEIRDNIRNKLTEIYNNTVSQLVEYIKRWVEWLLDMRQNTLDKFNEIKENIAKILSEALKNAVEWAKNMLEEFKQLPENIKSAVDSGMNGVFSAFSDWLGKMWNKAKEMAKKIGQAISKAFDKDKKHSPSVMDRVEDLVNSVNNTLPKITVPTFSKFISEEMAKIGENWANFVNGDIGIKPMPSTGDISNAWGDFSRDGGQRTPINQVVNIDANVDSGIDLDTLSSRIAFNLKNY
jgi:phage-related protein